MVRLKQQYASDLRALAAMRRFVRDACRQAGWQEPADETAIIHLELALSEAVGNITLHAYKGQKDQPIELSVEADGEKLTLTLQHRGTPFDPQSAAIPPPSFDGSRESGFGLYLIRQCVEEVQYFNDEEGACGIRLLQKRMRLPKQGEHMELLVDKVGDVTVVTVNLEQLDASNADDFRRDMAAILPDCAKLVLDFGRVQFVDSRGCGAILSCLKQVSSHGGDLKLCQVARPVRVVFELIRMNRICEIVNTREEAVKAFQK